MPRRVFSTAYRCIALYALISISGRRPVFQLRPENQSARKKLPNPHPGNFAYSSSRFLVTYTSSSRISYILKPAVVQSTATFSRISIFEMRSFIRSSVERRGFMYGASANRASRAKSVQAPSASTIVIVFIPSPFITSSSRCSSGGRGNRPRSRGSLQGCRRCRSPRSWDWWCERRAAARSCRPCP